MKVLTGDVSNWNLPPGCQVLCVKQEVGNSWRSRWHIGKTYVVDFHHMTGEPFITDNQSRENEGYYACNDAHFVIPCNTARILYGIGE